MCYRTTASTDLVSFSKRRNERFFVAGKPIVLYVIRTPRTQRAAIMPSHTLYHSECAKRVQTEKERETGRD